MFAADCPNVGLFFKAICCSSSSVIVFCSVTGVCARPGKATRQKDTAKQSTDRVTQRIGDTVSILISVNFTGAVRLLMFVLHSRHVHFHWFIAFLLFSKLHDVVVLVWRQHAYERHHSRHEAAPARTQAEVFRFTDHLIHRHRGTFHEGAFPCLAPCRGPRAFHFCVTSDRPLTTSGSSCGEEDGNAASSRQDCLQQIPHREIALLLRALYFQDPTWIAAVVLLHCL